MATRSNLLYSAAAIRRMLGLKASVPVHLREFFKVVWVWVKGQRPTFISKADLKAHFVEHRQDEARSLQVTDWLRTPPRYTVTNPASGAQYIVAERGDRLDCTCEDYHWQQQFFGRGCCKHGYAVLQYLGYDSLGQYAAAHRADAPSPQQPHRPEQLDLSGVA
ncbi:hypothetical protein C7271_04980 [filamentous cyanobacterium CCP5]|nr:hypothetical protein C7271_04980 [filamentous cyanobacterium CCP5]